MEYYCEGASEIPVVGSYDVAVAGGGPAGLSAALSAAGEGAKVFLAEAGGCLGGTATAGLMARLGGLPRKRLHGMAKAIENRLLAEGGGSYTERGYLHFDIEAFKYLALRMVTDSGAKLRLYTRASEPIVENGVIKGFTIEGKSGREAVLAKTVVDATGDSDLAYRAGTSTVTGRESDHKMRPIALNFRVGGIDLDRFEKYLNETDEPFAVKTFDRESRVVRLFGWQNVVKTARANGDMPEALHYLRFEGLLQGNSMIMNVSRMYDLDASNSDDLTDAVIEGYEQNHGVVGVLRKYVPGFEGAMLLETASLPGIRETRRIIGRHVVTEADLAGSVKYHDNVLTTYYEGVVGREMHSPDGNEGKLDEKPRERTGMRKENKIHMPLRALLPQGVENMVVAGRIMSAHHLASIFFRGILKCIETGQVAGIAAAMAAGKGCAISELAPAELRGVLRKKEISVE